MASDNDNVSEAAVDPKDNFAADIESLKNSFSQLRSDLTNLVGNALGASKSGAGVVRERAAHVAANAVDGLKNRFSDLKDKGAVGAEAVEEKIVENPIASALIAFGAGFILAKMLSRK
jgi:ElaB/YqjD/DUF883 family membrane-anchored ribosome-binding protein